MGVVGYFLLDPVGLVGFILPGVRVAGSALLGVGVVGYDLLGFTVEGSVILGVSVVSYVLLGVGKLAISY